MENKDKRSARLSLGLSRIVDAKKHVIWQSLLSPFSPHFMRAETAGWTSGEDEEIQSTELSWISISDPTRKMGQNEFVWLVGFLTSSSTTRLYRGWAPRQSVWNSRERAATAGIEPWTSSPGVARSTDWATAPPAEWVLWQSLQSQISIAGLRQR